MKFFDAFKKRITGDTVSESVAEEKPNTAPEPKSQRTRKPKPQVSETPAVKKSDKELATERGEPWVGIVSIDLDPDNVGNGAFELDWNDIFLAKLVRAGFQGKNDQQIVDQWFQSICRNILLETFEQYEANEPRAIVRRDLGNGRSENY